MMRRVVSIWLQDWPVTVWGKGPGRAPPAEDVPFALVDKGAHGLALSGLNRAARALGLRHGQAHADACAIAPHLVSAPAEPARDSAALRKLALWAERWSPAVALDGDRPELEGLFLDVTGAAHLRGGERQMLADIRARLVKAGIGARLAMAGTPGAAWALARYTALLDPIAPPGEERAALAGLPVEGLRLSQRAAQLLGRFGLRRIGDLYPLPRAALARRFRGAEGMEVSVQLDRALGLLAEALVHEQRPASYRAWQVFAEPVTVNEALAVRAEALVADLCAALERDGMGARRVLVTGFRVDGRATVLEAALGAPSRRPRHILRLLAERGWERLDLGFGVDALMVSAPVAERLDAIQSDSEAGPVAADAAARAALMDRLTARLGAAAVSRPVLVESWIPERSEVLQPCIAGKAQRTDRAGTPLSATDPANTEAGDRPLLLLPTPERIDATAELPEGAPGQFIWRRVQRRVVRAAGPERLSPEWWRTGDARERTRDYYRLEDDGGGRYWVFREGLYNREDGGDFGDREPSWWMHGVFA
jgi:protein ImuB